MLRYGRGVLSDVRGDIRTGTGAGALRTISASALLAVLVAAAAGIAGTTRFSGPRWVPHLSIRPHQPTRSAPRSAAPAERASPAPRGATHLSLGSVLWVLAGLAVLGASFLLWRWWSNRASRRATGVHAAPVSAARPAPAAPEPEQEPEHEKLLSGIELAIQVLEEPREPTDAIVRAWLGLEETAAASGVVRRPSETPSELASRILRSVVADDRAIRTLLRLYLQTRFGDHPVTGDDVSAVREALRALVGSWHAASQSAARAR